MDSNFRAVIFESSFRYVCNWNDLGYTIETAVEKILNPRYNKKETIKKYAVVL